MFYQIIYSGIFCQVGCRQLFYRIDKYIEQCVGIVVEIICFITKCIFIGILHQARHRPARRDARAEEPDDLDQRQCADRAVYALPVSARRRRRWPLAGPAAQIRSGDRAVRPLLHDGRQPRRLAGQPLLGLPAAVVHQGPGAVHLLVVRHPRRRLSCDVLPRNPLGPPVPSDPLRKVPERPIRTDRA